jgi:hypothetical protein
MVELPSELLDARGDFVLSIEDAIPAPAQFFLDRGLRNALGLV